MKGIRFYLEYESPRAKRENRNTGNCVAVMEWTRTNTGHVKSLLVTDKKKPDSEPMEYDLYRDYTKLYCKRIPEPIARIIHPKLFEVLDNLNSKTK
jgi:hypothetical protein